MDDIRYLLFNMQHEEYDAAIAYFLDLHLQKDPNNTLTVRPNVANTQAIVKVVAHEGWTEEEAPKVPTYTNNGLLLAVYRYEDLPTVRALLASSEWPQNG